MKELIEKAFAAREKAYAPYSLFRVGAAVLTADGKIYTGCNVENASYGASICAERVSITKSLSEGERKEDFKEIHILGSVSNTMPCFICRQTFIEFFDKDVKIYVYDLDGNCSLYTMNDLCPVPFFLGDKK